ncbi:hypothetical protein F2Q69_00054087 [Brassica cretica]|uniref:Uncharacterized protein n=1 Tax=Brassica cretica TaxID=69181 RepID=A0A8S9MZJ6_BRACR|nr:hypothetical protein F2Q69_00054087 [Brassica cretica]
MGLSYLYGKKFVAAPTPLILQLREEICLQPYKEISWSQARNLCAKVTEAIIHPRQSIYESRNTSNRARLAWIPYSSYRQAWSIQDLVNSLLMAEALATRADLIKVANLDISKFKMFFDNTTLI